MKKLISLFICIIAVHIAIGQGVGVGTTTPDASAKLDVSSTTQGMLVPRMTTTQRAAISTPATGLLVFDMTTNSFWFKGGTTWVELIDSANTVVHRSGPDIYLGMNGNVGVGTILPTAKLDIKTTGSIAAMSLRDDNVRLTVKMETDKAVIKTETASALQLNANNGTDQFTIATSGMVGIGNPTPELPLSFANTFGGKIALKKTAASYFGFGVSPGALQIHSDGPSSDILFGYNNGTFTETTRMTGTGRFGIGTNNPTAMLSAIRGTAPDGTAAFNGTTYNSYFNKSTNENTYINGGKAGANVLINSEAGLGFVGIGTATPMQMLHVEGSGFFAGALGIGILAPSFPLHFSAASGDKIALSGSVGALFGFGIQPNLMQVIAPNSSAAIGFGTGSSNAFNEKMRLTGDGKLGIGTQNPASKLDVNGDVNIGGGLAVGLGVAVAGGLGVGGAVGIGIQTPNPSAILDLTSTNKGLLLPRMSTTQREAIASPAAGLTVYDNTTNSPWYRDGDTWKEMKPDTTSFTPLVFRNGPDMIYMGLTDSVGIGTSTPDYKLQVVTGDNMEGISHTNGDVDIVTRVSSTYGGAIGTKTTDQFEIFANGGENQFVLSPSGNIGIGMVPTNKVDIASATRTGTHPNSLPLYVTGNIGTNTGGMEVRKTDATQGVGIGSNTVYATGAVQDLRIEAKGATGTAKIATNGVERMFVTGSGNVGIGNSTPNAPLQFANTSANRKVVLFELANNDIQFSGFGTGTSPNSIRYQLCDTIGNHTFFGGRTSNSKELMRIQGNGNVGIGMITGTALNNKLDVAEFTRTNLGSHPTNLPLYVTGDIGTNVNGMEVRTSDAAQGVGIGSTTVYATAALQDLGLEAKGATGRLKLSTNGLERMSVTGAGNVGIGTISPNAPLQFTSVEATRKIVLYEGGNNDNQFFGFGINSSALRYQAIGDHVFYAGVNSTTSKEQMRMTFGGNLGIGISAPLASLEVARGTGGLGTMSLHGTTYLTNFNEGANEHTSIRGGKANSNVLINDLAGLGNVGIGTPVPLQKLHVEGSTYISQNLGIGTNLPNAPLQFSNATQNRKIVLYEGVPNNDHQYYGFGVNGSILRYQVSNPNDNHVFYAAAASGTSSNELMRIQGNGNVGINKSDPQNMLDIQSGTARTGTHASGRALYVTGDIEASSNGIEFRHYNGTQGIGFGYNTIYATGSDADQNLGIQAKGTTGNLLFSTNGNERMRVAGDGSVGIGVTNPQATLEIARGTAIFGTLQVDGTAHNSHFNYGAVEDTYIRGGNEGSRVLINDIDELGNVGIGTANPLQKLHVGGSLAVDNKVGIGVTSPVEKLEVNGNAKVTGQVMMGYSNGFHTYSLNPTDSGNYSCDCPVGTKAIGGGWAGGGLIISGSWAASDGSKWFVGATNIDVFPHGLSVNAICARIGQ
jgi:hypothetical protein